MLDVHTNNLNLFELILLTTHITNTNMIFMQLPPLLCKYFTWIDHEVPKDVQEDQRRDCLRRQRLFEESFARGLERECHEKEKNERKKREEERVRKEKEARQEERAKKLARARDAQQEDEARDKKGKWPRTTQQTNGKGTGIDDGLSCHSGLLVCDELFMSFETLCVMNLYSRLCENYVCHSRLICNVHNFCVICNV